MPNKADLKTITAAELVKDFPYAVVRIIDDGDFYVSNTYETIGEAIEHRDNMCNLMGHTYEVRQIVASESQELAHLSERIAELEEEKVKLVEVMNLMAETLRTPEPIGILDGGPEVSEHLQARIKNFEGGLRHLCHQAYALQFELADEGHVCHVDGRDCWGYGSKRMQNVSDELEGMIKHYFGGFNYPTD